MKKNLLSMALATVVAASLVGCGSTAADTQTAVSENAEKMLHIKEMWIFFRWMQKSFPLRMKALI